MQEVEKGVQAKEHKDEAQQDACDENSDLHRSPLNRAYGGVGANLLKSRLQQRNAINSS